MKWYQRFSLLFLLIFWTVLSSCSPKPPIKIAISAWAGVEPAELAARLGYYEKYGVDVEMVRFSAYTDSIEALRKGKTNAGMHTLDDAIRYYAAGKDVRIVLFTDYSYGGDGIVAQKDIQSVSDLVGKTVGVELATVGHFSLLKALENHGLAEEDINIVSIPAWEIKDAFLEGTIDAGVTWEPYLTSSAEEGDGNIITTSRDYPDSIVTSMVFDMETIEQRPRDVQKIVMAYFDAVEFIKSNPEEAYRIMAAAEDINPEEFASHVDGLQYLDLEGNITSFSEQNGALYSTAQELASFLYEKGVIDHMPDTNQLLEPAFIMGVK